MLQGDAIAARPVGDVRPGAAWRWAGPWGPGVRPGQGARVRDGGAETRAAGMKGSRIR